MSPSRTARSMLYFAWEAACTVAQILCLNCLRGDFFNAIKRRGGMMSASISSTAPNEVVLQAHDAENMKPAEFDEIHLEIHFDINYIRLKCRWRLQNGNTQSIQGERSGSSQTPVDITKQKLLFSIRSLYKNATFVLMSTGGWDKSDVSPCRESRLDSDWEYRFNYEIASQRENRSHLPILHRSDSRATHSLLWQVWVICRCLIWKKMHLGYDEITGLTE